ncbi:MAG: hypothetical protein RBJ76_17705 [Stenomitos frigidus ULC029]
MMRLSALPSVLVGLRFAIALLIATIGLFGFGYAPTLWLAIAFCVLNSGEEIVMTLVLPAWQHDVLSLAHALKLRDIAKG